jgi:hypothetical protein
MKRSTPNSSGRITSGISYATVPLRIIAFVREQLPAWRDDPSRPPADTEPILNPQLCKFLNARARNEFPMIAFGREEPQVGRRQVDLSALPSEGLVINARPYTIYDPVLVIECKRIPAPSGDREKEYVTGADPTEVTGGIQRFKLGQHGANMDMAAMVGYVQSGTATQWSQRINAWILELVDSPIGDGCVWSPSDQLEELQEYTSTDVTSYHSVHERSRSTTGNKIELHHLWIIMCEKTRVRSLG